MDAPIKAMKSRIILLHATPTKDQLDGFLRAYYQKLRGELSNSKRSTRQIWVYVFDDMTRAKAGMGEWIGMISGMAHEGRPLPSNPEPDFKLPDPGTPKPTAKENQIHDDLLKALFENPDTPEEVVLKRIARKYRISVKKLKDINIKVMVYRN